MTSKADKQIHGFGVKSIRLLAEKYAGMISIMPTEDTFSIDLVFPVGQYDADHPKKNGDCLIKLMKKEIRYWQRRAMMGSLFCAIGWILYHSSEQTGRIGGSYCVVFHLLID